MEGLEYSTVTSPKPTAALTVEKGEGAGVLICALSINPENRQVANKNSPEISLILKYL